MRLLIDRLLNDDHFEVLVGALQSYSDSVWEQAFPVLEIVPFDQAPDTVHRQLRSRLADRQRQRQDVAHASSELEKIAAVTTRLR